MKTYGTVATFENTFVIQCPAHIRMRLKGLFQKINKAEFRFVRLAITAESCADLQWFLLRYPMEMQPATRRLIDHGADAYRAAANAAEEILTSDYEPEEYALAKPLRHYQAVAVDLYRRVKSLLLTDELGLGKTVTAMGAFTRKELLPALIVVPTHLPRQWNIDFLKEFLPEASRHTVKRGKIYTLPATAITLITYSKLAKWGDVLRDRGFKSVTFDEVQDLRHEGTAKYCAAEAIRETCEYALGMSATPIYNYGGEIHSVLKLLHHDRIPPWDEFSREWCSAIGNDHYIINEPETFGAYLREENLMLRRTREDVGMELPPIQTDVATIPHNADVLKEIQSSATELARLVLEGTFLESGQAAREFDIKLRQATGVAKAPFVADFVRMLSESGEKILLGAWHREVWGIYLERLADLRPLLYTGTESPAQKAEAIRRFRLRRAKDTGYALEGCDILCMSLRSGTGVDGLQGVCRVSVFGELDWSPQVHKQFTGRLQRDGLMNNVMEYYLVSDAGSDPTVASVLGLKAAQARGIMDPDKLTPEFVQSSGERVKQLAKDWLDRRDKK